MLNRDEQIRHWYFLADLNAEANKARDRNIAAGSAGALLLSITFISQLASDPAPWSLVLLVVAWGCLLLSLGGAVYGWHSTSQAFPEHMRTVSEMIAGAEHPTPVDPKADKITRATLAVSLVSLPSGIAFLAVFAIVNLPWGG